MANLTAKGLLDPLRAYITSGRPYFGICIGMQVLFTHSSESPARTPSTIGTLGTTIDTESEPRHQGLGIIDSEIGEFDNAGKPVPHMGWNSVSLLAASAEDRARERRETGVDDDGATYYFVHSYRAAYFSSRNGSPDAASADWGHTTTQYGREIFLATVRKGNVFACQFHPEKSGKAGLKVLKSWLEAPIHTVDAEYSPRSKRLMTINEMDGFTKRIIACMDVRANDDGDLVVTKGDQYDVREKDDVASLQTVTAELSVISIATNGSTPNSGTQAQTAPPHSSPKRQVRNLGKPVALALRYYESGADEICLLNITSFRNSPLHDQPMLAVVREAASRIFVPLTIGGGIKDSVDPDGTARSALEVASAYFRAGADKISIGSEAVTSVERLRDPERLNGVPNGKSPIEAIARVYGRQAVVVSVDPKKIYVDPATYDPLTGAYDGPYADEVIHGSSALGGLVDKNDKDRAWYYQCTIKGGRELRPLSVKQLVQGAEALGAGEILVNSIDRDGTNAGFDLDLVDLVRRSVRIPVVASSGAGSAAHFVDVFERTGVEAALAAGIFHRREVELSEVKNLCQTRGVIVRSGL